MAAEEASREAGKAERPPIKSYLRFEETAPGEGRLDTAVATFRRKDGAQVDLIAAVHVADRGYYEALSKRFEGYDKVLFELVKPKDADLSKVSESRGASVCLRSSAGSRGSSR